MSGRREPQEDIGPLFIAEKAARLVIEETGADAVVILWTTQKRRSTRFWRHQFGNALLCNALVSQTAEDQDSAKEDDEDDE